MKPSLWNGALVAAAMVVLAGCDSTTEPEVQVPVDLVLDFCANDVPVFFAYQNQGQGWNRVIPNAEGAVSFTATNDVVLAFVHQMGTAYRTEFVFAANTELQKISGVACLEETGTKVVNGSVSGVSAGQLGQVTMNFASVYVTSSQNTFSLAGLPDRAVDLVASRVNVTGATQASDRVIIRRSQAYVNNATMPPLDFNAPAAIVPVTVNATVTGVLSGDEVFVTNNFFSQLETSHMLGYQELGTNGSVPLPAIPTASMAAGDYHDLFAIAVDATGAGRGVERYFTTPANQSLALGPVMSQVSVSTDATTPTRRMRAVIPRQLTYGDAAAVFYVQETQFASTEVNVTMTAGYDASGSWTLTMPDLSGVSGWQNAWGLNGVDGVQWTAFVFGGRPELLFGSRPLAAETIMFANRASPLTGMSAMHRSALAVWRPRLLARGR